MTRYSQNDEQDVILKFFAGQVGHVLDIGAFDGVTFSNTRALLELGWGGVLVEPDPYNVIRLIDSVEPFADRVDVVAAAVGPRNTLPLAHLGIDQTDGRAWASSIVPGNPNVHRPMKARLSVPVVTVESLLERGPFQFVNIDAEGMDWSILCDMPARIPGCEMLCIEPPSVEARDDFKVELAKRGFVTHHETHENIIAVRTL